MNQPCTNVEINVIISKTSSNSIRRHTTTTIAIITASGRHSNKIKPSLQAMLITIIISITKTRIMIILIAIVIMISQPALRPGWA